MGQELQRQDHQLVTVAMHKINQRNKQRETGRTKEVHP